MKKWLAVPLVVLVTLLLASPARADHTITYTPDLSSLPVGWQIGCDDVFAATGQHFGCEGSDVSATFTATAGGFYFVHPAPGGTTEAWGMWIIPISENFTLTNLQMFNTTNDTESGYWWNVSTMSGGTEYSSHGGSVLFDGTVSTACYSHCSLVAGDWIAVGVDLHYAIDDETVSNLVITGTAADGIESTDVFGGGGISGLYRPVRTGDTLAVTNTDPDVITTARRASIFAPFDGTITDISTNAANNFDVTINGSVVLTNLASVYIAEGDSIAGGCVIGSAGDSPTSGNTQQGEITFTPSFGWQTWTEPASNTPCAASTTHCVNANPDILNGAEQWSSEGNIGSAQIASGSTPTSVDLYYLANIRQTVTLNEATAYYVTIIAAPLEGTSGALRVQIGGVETHLEFNTTAPLHYVTATTQALSLGSPTYAPSDYIFKVTNDWLKESPGMRITFVCLHEGDIQIAPGSCYFDDFDMTGDSFEKSSGATFVPAPLIGEGSHYHVPDSEYIYHSINISAFVDADTDYTLKLSSKNPDGTLTTPPYGHWHAKIVDHANPATTLQDIGDIAVNWQIIYGFSTATFTVAEAESISGDLIIENVSNSIDSSPYDLDIGMACLSVEGGIWPGYEDADTTAPRLGEYCQTCTAPDGFDVVAWLAWIGCIISNLIRCYLAQFLNGIWATIISLTDGLGLLGRWLSASITLLASWLWMGLGRLIAQLITFLIPIINSILSWLQSLPIVQSLLDTAGLAAIWFDGIWNFILSVIDLFLSGLYFIVVLFGLVGTAWSGFIEGITTTSAVTFPFPDCTNPATPFYDACLPLDILNFLGTKIPAVLVLANIAAISIAWREIRKAWRKTDEALSNT